MQSSLFEAEAGIEQKQPFRLLRYYHPATKGAQPHNKGTPKESGTFACESSTRHRASNTNRLLTDYSFTARSLALSLALPSAKNPVLFGSTDARRHGAFVTLLGIRR
jgi:hypothetical protein